MTLRHGGRAVLRAKALVAALGVAALIMAVPAPPVGAVAAEDDAIVTYTPVTVVQANLNKDMGATKFQQDLARVFAEQPDFITFNEVHRRDDALLAPNGYDLFRTPGPRTGWAPVAWRSDIWTAVGQGTWKISNSPARFQNTREPMRGLRYANWVTLSSTAGEVVSVISAHIAPNNRDTAELLVPSLKRLRVLANQLGELGPVILGGDFNMGYHGDRYQPQYLAAAGLHSTFDRMGSSFWTHRRGGTIDYIFLGPDERFVIDEQYPVLLNSDHRMMVAHLQLATEQVEPPPPPLPSFAPGTVVADARGSAAERRAIRSLQLRAIQATPAGAAIHIASETIRGRPLLRALIDAKTRGADVTVITGRRELSTDERELRRLLGRDSTASSYYVTSRRAWPASPREARRRAGVYLRPTELLISTTGATRAFALWADSNLGLAPLKPRFGMVSTARVATSLKRYDRSYRRYLAVIGRTY